MRFTESLSKIANENTALKWVIISLSLVVVGAMLLIMTLATKSPLVIERECQSRAVDVAQAAPTNAEIEAFIREAIHARFDFDGIPTANLLSLSEIKLSDKDRKELKDRNMRQRVLVNDFKRDGDRVEINTDRLISVGELRSALQFPLILTLGSTARSVTNPYGLILVGTEPKKSTEGKNSQSPDSPFFGGSNAQGR